MNETILTILLSAIAAGALWLVRKAAALMTEKINAAKGDSLIAKSTLAKIGLETAEAAVKAVAEAVVGKIEEIEGKALREKVRNGEANMSVLFNLAEKAYQEIKQTVKPELMEILSASVGDVELYIRNTVESQLGLLKRK